MPGMFVRNDVEDGTGDDDGCEYDDDDDDDDDDGDDRVVEDRDGVYIEYTKTI